MIYEHRLRVRYAETDAMRVAHHTAYLVWFEEGRVEALRSLGFSFADIEAGGYGHAVHEVCVRYRRPARFDQALLLRIAVAGVAGPRLTFAYRVYDAAEWDRDGAAQAQPIATGITVMIWVTPDGRPTRIPASHPLRAVLASLQCHPEWTES